MIPGKLISLISIGLIIGCFAGACVRQASTEPATLLQGTFTLTVSPQSTLIIITPSHTTAAIVPSKTVTTVLPVTTNLPATPTQNIQLISIDSVQVTQGTGVYVHGITDLPDGECIQTNLLADNQPESWWPRDVCIQVETGQWEILVSLGRRGAPTQLDDGIQYEIHAWYPKVGQETLISFPFDLSGPPGLD
jgi:hypothetical protein